MGGAVSSSLLEDTILHFGIGKSGSTAEPVPGICLAGIKAILRSGKRWRPLRRQAAHQHQRRMFLMACFITNPI
jgi:hypothetical protein